MRVYYHSETEAIIVEGTRAVYPPRSIRFIEDDPNLEIWLKGEGVRLLGPVHHSRIQDEQGNTFSTFAQTMEYLRQVSAKAPEDLSNIADLVAIFNTELQVPFP